MKPHKGKFSNCRKVVVSEPTEEHLGYYFVGIFDPNDTRKSCSKLGATFSGRLGHTSLVVKADGAEIETFNSRYTIVNCINSDEFKAKNNYEPIKG